MRRSGRKRKAPARLDEANPVALQDPPQPAPAFVPPPDPPAQPVALQQLQPVATVGAPQQPAAPQQPVAMFVAPHGSASQQPAAPQQPVAMFAHQPAASQQPPAMLTAPQQSAAPPVVVQPQVPPPQGPQVPQQSWLGAACHHSLRGIHGRDAAPSKLAPDRTLHGQAIGSRSDHVHRSTITVSNCSCPKDLNKCLHLGPSPININKLKLSLQDYPKPEDAKLLANGFHHGFKIEHTGPRSFYESRNLRSAYDHKAELLEKIYKEISLGRIAGPFLEPPFPNLHVSPVGVVPKSDGGWRLITHLSFPPGSSINDGIDPQFCSVRYTSFDMVTKMIYSLGRSALIAKRDLKSAYRLLPIRTEDFPLLGLKIEQDYFIDKFLPMGLSQSARLFETFSTFLHWLVARRAKVSSIAHLLDDFLFAGPRNSRTCRDLVDVFESTCAELGIPIAEEKSVNPTTIMVFLGLELDTNEMSVRVPIHRIDELKSLIDSFLARKKVSLKELQSLVGKLNFFGQAVRSSRAFLRRFYDAMSPLKKPHHLIRVSRELKEDLLVWHYFLLEFNGVTYIPQQIWLSSHSLRLYTDASGSANGGAGCFLDGQWCFYPWPQAWSDHAVLRDMTFLEMVPVLAAILLWGARLANAKVKMYIDNMALVQVLNKQSAKSKRVMQLVRPFVMTCMKLNIYFQALHVPSKQNVIADSISRQQWARFRQAAPDADPVALPVPPVFRSIISGLRLDD